MANYWSRVLETRVGRRRALVASGGVALSAAFLAACGGDDSGGGSSQTKTNLPDSILKPVDTSKTAKRGGVWKGFLGRDPQNFDLYNFDPFSQPFANTVGSKLVKMKPGFMEDPSLAVEPDVAQSWELSPDKLSITFKLNPAAKWAPLGTPYYQGTPTAIANRIIDSEDVLAAWERWAVTASASGADELVNSRQPSAPVTSITAPDKSTVVMKLNKPFAPLLVSLGNGSVSYFYLMPKEIKGGGVDPFKHQFGSGPFMINTYEPSVRMTLKRNPNYELRDTEFKRPYVDTVELPIVPDASSQLAQFRTGAVMTPNAGGQTVAAGRPIEDVLQLKKDFPEMQMTAFRGADGVQMWFGMSKDGPWKDARVRQAMSLSWDRDLYITTIHGTDKLEAAGIPGNHQWNAAYPAGEVGIGAFKGWYLNPKDPKEFGENAKYFTLGDRAKDLAEAKKLLAAAGHANGLSFKHVQYPIVPPVQQRSQDVIEGMISEAGFKVTGQEKVTIPQIFSDYINNGGEFKDLLNTLDFGGPDPGAYFRTHMHKAGSLFGGWDVDGRGPNKEGDPFLNDTIEKLLGEFDDKKRVAYGHDIIRYLGKQLYKMRYPGGATQLGLAWPALQNLYVWRGYGLAGSFAYEWLDPTKAPLNK
ncbi:MAG TPA: ABC transporter substrate-binding protein, partial [Dehalococcoidia bacterium]|nr:ABC transporter substrate-binding protein [Dehalococcoidia bacterium]